MSIYIDCENTLCRICLTQGAHIPIFEKNEVTKESVESKIVNCINQKVEDIMGYPRNICTECNTTLDSIRDFINKFVETSKALKKLGLHSVKREFYLQDDFDTFQENCLESSEDEIEKETKVTEVKVENEFTESHLDEAENLKMLLNIDLPIKKIKFEPLDSKQKICEKQRSSNKSKNKTNKIASSILEGNFEWTDSKWCLISSITKKKNTTKKKKNTKCLSDIPKKEKKVQHREPEIKIPKEKAPPEPKLCDFCGKTFTNTDKFRRHKELHTGHQSGKCPHCDFICKRKEYIRRHILMKHTSTKKHVCDVCGKRFALRNFLNKHLKSVHENKKRLFPCPMCDKKYLAPKSVEVHIRSAHTGDRPAVCTVCDASFFTESYLKEHMRLHTGETPFKCPVCGRGYAQRGNMKSHILHNHKRSQLTTEQLNTIKPIYLKIMKE